MISENLLALIPAYNEQKKIGEVIEQTTRYVETVCVVDDGSTDKTPDIAREQGAILLSHSTNLGKGAALARGFTFFLKGDWELVVTLDADGQHDPAKIPDLLEEFQQKDLDLLLASRYSEMKRLPWIRRLTNRITSVFISVAAEHSYLDTQSGYRLLRRGLIENLDLNGTDFDYEAEMLIEAGRKKYNIGEFDVGLPCGPGSDSKWNLISDPYRIVRILVHYYTGQSTLP